jgi:hypothetical protein
MFFSAREYKPKGYLGLVCALAAGMKPAQTEQPTFYEDAPRHEFVAGSPFNFQANDFPQNRLLKAGLPRTSFGSSAAAV